MKDTYRYKGLRRQLVEELRRKGIADENVLAVINAIPRHFFFEKGFEAWAYEDKAFPIAHEQTISQPYTVAFQTQLLEVKAKEKILEVGTGSGYQAAILAALGARVFTIERQEGLYVKAKKMLPKLGFEGIRFFWKDGYKGLPEFAPFDKIIVTAGAPEVPKTLLLQLAIGGVMVAPIGEKVQQMLRITRVSKDEYRVEDKGPFRFVPFLSGLERK